jgi:hypothetical protein
MDMISHADGEEDKWPYSKASRALQRLETAKRTPVNDTARLHAVWDGWLRGGRNVKVAIFALIRPTLLLSSMWAVARVMVLEEFARRL